MFNQKIMFNQNCNCSSKTISVPEPNMQQTRVSQDIHALATSYMHWLHHGQSRGIDHQSTLLVNQSPAARLNRCAGSEQFCYYQSSMPLLLVIIEERSDSRDSEEKFLNSCTYFAISDVLLNRCCWRIRC